MKSFLRRWRASTLLFALAALAACTQTDQPVIESFTASDATVIAGSRVTLSWSAGNYDTLTLTPAFGDVTEQTSLRTVVEETTTYTLTATKGPNRVSRTLEVVVGEVPEILRFAPTLSPVAPGEPTVLEWQVEGAESLQLSPEPGDVSGRESATVTPTEDTLYTLSATNAFGSVQRTTEVEVGEGPTVVRFSALPERLAEPGGEVTLSWSVEGEGALEVEITSDGGHQLENLDDEGSETLTVSETTVFTLSAQDAKGTRNATATVRVGAAPEVSFSASPSSPIREGESVTLNWTVTGEEISSVHIDPTVGSVANSGSRSVSPNQTTTYTLSATNPYGTTTETLTVTVWPPISSGPYTFLIAGQSNAVGQGEITEGCGNCEPPIAQVRMLGNDYVWKMATEPVDSNEGQEDSVSRDSDPGHSFGVRFGKELYEATGQSVYLIPSARGGSCLQNPCSFPIWDPAGTTDRTTLYGSAVYRARLSAGAITNPENGAGPEGGPVDAILWYQGESDSYSGTVGDNFIANTNEVMDRFRRDIGLIPTIYVQLAVRRDDTSRSPYYQNTRERQRQMETGYGSQAREDFYMVVAHDLPMIDQNHLNTAGQKELGERLALAYMERVLGLPVDGTGPRLVSITRDPSNTNVIRVKTTSNELTQDLEDNDYENYFRVFADGSDTPLASSQISVEREPTDESAIRITLLSGDYGTLRVAYLPPSSRAIGERMNNVVRDADSGLPLPAFGFATDEPGLPLERGLPIGFRATR